MTDYSKTWDTQKVPEFWQWMHDSRKPTHDAFRAWAAGIGLAEDSQVLEVGCGIGQHAESLPGVYAGIDVCMAAIRYAGVARPKGYFFTGRIEDEDTGLLGWFDLIFSLGVIDHVPDIPAFVTACVSHLAPGGWLYINAYRGWDPDLRGHRYTRDSGGTYYNDIDHELLGAQMHACGLADVRVDPGATCDEKLGPEMVAIGRKP